MQIPLTNRNQLEGLDGGSWIVQTLTAIIASISARWDVQHNDDGSHGVVTVGSLRGPKILAGADTPEGSVTAPLGSLYLRTDGSTSTTLYVKTTAALNTGWTAK